MGGRGCWDGGWRLFDAGRSLTFTTLGWALIRAWALNRINTVPLLVSQPFLINIIQPKKLYQSNIVRFLFMHL